MPNSKNVLIVDDEEGIRAVIGDSLESKGYLVAGANNAMAALEACAKMEFALALVDLRLPGAMDGVGLLSELRRQFPNVLVLMLTGYATIDSAIAALRQGAHDYLIKPISMSQLIDSVDCALAKRGEETRRNELIARLEETLQELKQENTPAIKEASDRFLRARALTIDRQKRWVVTGNQPVNLSATEFDVLDYLARNSGRIVAARELLKAVQGYDANEMEASPIVRVHIQRLRQKLQDDPERPRFIANVRGKGYRFVG